MRLILLAVGLLAGCMQLTPEKHYNDVGTSHSLSLNQIMTEADFGGIIFGDELIYNGEICFNQTQISIIFGSLTYNGDICFNLLVEGQANEFNQIIISEISRIIIEGECDSIVTPIVFSYDEGPINSLYFTGNPHILFHGSEFGWVLVPISNAAVEHVLSVGLCQLTE